VAADKPEKLKTSPAVAPAALLLAEIERLKSELSRAELKVSELELRADVDPLLDILNRRGFERELKRSLAYLQRYQGEAALLFIDLDGFKAVNDQHGHAAGDEFGVLLWNFGAALAAAKARELEKLIEAVSVAHGEARLAVGGSAGLVPLAVGATPEQMIDAADQAMYARKKERRS
jgi:GGDEF domain-containing protein